MNDQAIVDLYWSRSEQAIVVSDEQYGAYCQTIAMNILRDFEDAKECRNETFWRAWQAIPPAKPTRLATFFGKLTRNLAIDRYRQQSAQKRQSGMTQIFAELDEIGWTADSVTQASDEIRLLEAINQFLASRPLIQSQIFLLRYFYAYPVKVIARRAGLNPAEVSQLLFQMRQHLKDYLRKEDIVV